MGVFGRSFKKTHSTFMISTLNMSILTFIAFLRHETGGEQCAVMLILLGTRDIILYCICLTAKHGRVCEGRARIRS